MVSEEDQDQPGSDPDGSLIDNTVDKLMVTHMMMPNNVTATENVMLQQLASLDYKFQQHNRNGKQYLFLSPSATVTSDTHFHTQQLDP